MSRTSFPRSMPRIGKVYRLDIIPAGVASWTLPSPDDPKQWIRVAGVYALDRFRGVGYIRTGAVFMVLPYSLSVEYFSEKYIEILLEEKPVRVKLDLFRGCIRIDEE